MNTKIVDNLKKYFATQPIKKAWLFGAFSRGEETSDSDVDIMVRYDDNADVSLFTVGGIYMDLRNLLGRDIDLVEENTFEPYAAGQANNEKILIYERTY
ncbi:MAG: nucleotidyltransferase domain-containing protein [Prevotella sp.]|nr:nucleotidyltransferase domain-containing protein [Prevotella sp.]